jgi:hypothetical protein
MGQSTSKLNLPSGKDYLISYCKHHDLKKVEYLELVDLSNLITLDDNLLDVYFSYKLKSFGYTFSKKISYRFDLPLNVLLKSIKIPNFEIKNCCYTVSLDTIKTLLSEFNILIAGIIIDKEFAKEILDTDITELLSDIILITGYTSEYIIIKTKWKKDFINLPFEYLGNIPEVWNLKLKSFEDKYLELLE